MQRRPLNSELAGPFMPGQSIWLVTRQGEVLEGFTIASILGELVALDKPPLADSDRHGFTVDGDLLRPNWCAGRRHFVAGCLRAEQAEALAARRRK